MIDPQMGTGAVLAAAAALAGGALIRYRAGAWGLVQAPGDRSSHLRPTPTGGGAAIAIGVLGGLLWAPAAWWLWLVLLPGVGLAMVGFADDRHELAIWIRLTAQLIAATLLLLIAAALPAGMEGSLIGLAGMAGLVWWLNAFNFMDGIDGLAAAEAIFIGAGAAALLALGGTESPAVWLGIVMAAAVAGFLVHNWAPARLFMGDAGSYFLGFATAAMAVSTIAVGSLTLEAWLILAALFVADATVTLATRMASGKPVFEAHRVHAYQKLARRWNSHARVTSTAVAVNVVWLWPLALAAAAWPQAGWAFVAVAYAPLIVALIRLGAGRDEPA